MYDSGNILQLDGVSVYFGSDPFDNQSDSVQDEPGRTDRQGTDDSGNDSDSSTDTDLYDREVADVDLSTIEENQAVIISQIDNLNNNLVIFQNDNKITTGLLFSVLVILLVQIVYKLFYKILGLGQC